MVNSLLRSMYTSFSKVRVESYRELGQSDSELIVTYLWNVALAESLHPSLQAVELCLRNSLNNAIGRRHDQRRISSDHWLEYQPYFQKKQLDDLEGIRREYGLRHVPNPTADQIVSGTNMGFWVAILSRKYERHLWQTIGMDLLSDVFPYAPTRVSIRDFYKAFDQIRRLRNRANHYERICNREDLVTVHDHIHERIGWINPSIRTLVEGTDSFNLIHARGREFYRDRVSGLLEGI